MFDIGTDSEGMPLYYGYDFDTKIKQHIDVKSLSNVDYLIIKELHSNINYARICETMKALDWSWSFDDGSPPIEGIQDSALEMIINLFKCVQKKLLHDPTHFNNPINIPYSYGSGGFTVEYYGENAYKIYFSITNWDTFTYSPESEEDDEYYKNYCPEFYEARKIDQRKEKIKNILSN